MLDIEGSKHTSLHYWLLRGKYSLLEEPKVIIKNYLHRTRNAAQLKNSQYVFMVDGSRPHGGMFDRLKGMISIYALSKARKADFKVHFIFPFRLEKYLEPSKYDWIIDDKDIVYSYPNSRPLIVYGEWVHPTRIFKKRKGQVHVYYGFDSVIDVNRKFNTNYDFGTLYRELFKPTPYLQKYLDYYKQEIGRPYIVTHFRFTNMLGDKVEVFGRQEVLLEDKKIQIMEDCLQKMREISVKHPSNRIMLASDSNIFAQYVKKQWDDIYVIPGTIKHVDTTESTSEQENLKLFLDYYLISGADYVYSIINKEETLYPSDFPNYASKIGCVPFERVTL